MDVEHKEAWGDPTQPPKAAVKRRDVFLDKNYLPQQAHNFVPISDSNFLDYHQLIKEHGSSLPVRGLWGKLVRCRQDPVTTLRKIDVWFSFILALLYNLLVPLIVGALAYAMANTRKQAGALRSLQGAHRLLGTIVSITIGFKNKSGVTVEVRNGLRSMFGVCSCNLPASLCGILYSANDRFWEGQKVLSSLCQYARELVMGAYSAMAMDEKEKEKKSGKKDKKDDKEDFKAWLLAMQRQAAGREGNKEAATEKEAVPLDDLAWEVRRRTLILLSFVRQSVRESKKGFMPQSAMEAVPFSDRSFVYDMVLPRLQDMLTEAEYERYRESCPRRRPYLVAGELQCILEVFGTSLMKYSDLNRSGVKYLTGMLDAYESMLRIRDTKASRPYEIMMYVAMCLFVYATPFIYSIDSDSGHWARYPTVVVLVLTELLALFFFGIAYIGYELENPYGYGLPDIPLEEAFCQVSDDSDAIARDLASDCRSFIPAHLNRDTRPCKTGYLEVAYLRARSLWQALAAHTGHLSTGESQGQGGPQARETRFGQLHSGADVI